MHEVNMNERKIKTYTEVVASLIVSVQEQIDKSPEKKILISFDDIKREMGPAFEDMHDTCLQCALRYTMFDQGIVVEHGKIGYLTFRYKKIDEEFKKGRKTKEEIEKEIGETIELNEVMILGAKMVGYNVNAETEKIDKRIYTNIWQKARIYMLEAMLKEE